MEKSYTLPKDVWKKAQECEDYERKRAVTCKKAAERLTKTKK